MWLLWGQLVFAADVPVAPESGPHAPGSAWTYPTAWPPKLRRELARTLAFQIVAGASLSAAYRRLPVAAPGGPERVAHTLITGLILSSVYLPAFGLIDHRTQHHRALACGTPPSRARRRQTRAGRALYVSGVLGLGASFALANRALATEVELTPARRAALVGATGASLGATYLGTSLVWNTVPSRFDPECAAFPERWREDPPFWVR